MKKESHTLSQYNIEDLSYDAQHISRQIDKMTLSISGWRKIFAAAGDPESNEPLLSKTDSIITIAVAASFAEFIREKSAKGTPAVLIGSDSRPTGASIANLIIHTLQAQGVSVSYPGIICAPEIMAASASMEEIDGFLYITASHNPIGYNGFKFGLTNGGVLPPTHSNQLTENFKTLIMDKAKMERLLTSISHYQTDSIQKCFDESAQTKKTCEDHYRNLSLATITGYADEENQAQQLSTIKEGIKKRPLSILADYNGSARTLTIDETLLKEMGIGFKAINDKPGEIVHKILPEGDALNLCMKELEKEWKKDPSFLLGLVPDNDGDRGNIVYINEKTGKASQLDAQQVFAMAVLSELSWIDYTSQTDQLGNRLSDKKTAVVVNGPTSMRIDRICSAFSCRLFRAEVGEANVAGLAEDARKRGYLIRILGEGSNGGNITWPASVRDPLNTLFSFIKILTIKGDSDKPGLFKHWLQLTDRQNQYHHDFDLTDIVESLPAFITTASSDPRAIIKIKTTSQIELKTEYERILLDHWIDIKDQLKKEFGIYSWQVVNYEGKNENVGLGKEYRSGKQDGGFKVILKRHDGVPTGFIWMRGSRTEPIFRLLADVQGKDPRYEKVLLEWHRNSIKKADEKASQKN